ncbi:MAG: hypothetical protein ACXAC2_03735 [Candidatus Kariarchaeaceae archaeon]|jgi:hypothetical protein
MISIEQYQEAQEDNIGFCTECEAERDCCEPDAENYKCEECGANSVQGCDTLLLMGLVS